MIRDITLGQYYPVDSVLHRMDPRTKLLGTLVFIVSLFFANSISCYVAATLFLVTAVRMSKVPFSFMVQGLKAILFLLQDYPGGHPHRRLYGPATDLSGDRFLSHDADDYAE